MSCMICVTCLFDASALSRLYSKNSDAERIVNVDVWVKALFAYKQYGKSSKRLDLLFADFTDKEVQTGMTCIQNRRCECVRNPNVQDQGKRGYERTGR